MCGFRLVCGGCGYRLYGGLYFRHVQDHLFPDSSITREEAAIILTRNLMLQPDTGENTSFLPTAGS